MTTQRFTADNTDGYSDADLIELNAIFAELVAGRDLDPADAFDGSTLDFLAEEAERRFHESRAA